MPNTAINLKKYQPNFTKAKDSEIWSKQWNELFILDQENPDFIVRPISHYFKVEDAYTPSNEFRQRRFLQPTKNFLDAGNCEIIPAFLGLCEFLFQIRRPCRELHLEMKNHYTILPNSVFHPFKAFYKNSQYPYIDKNLNAILLVFNEETFSLICKYAYGEDIEIPTEPEIWFPFLLFRGAVV